MFLESQKKESLLGINSFNKPAELSGVQAWCDMIIRLITMMPGTYPSLPNMGVGLASYEYDTIDGAVIELTDKINDQIKTYLPDIPVDKVTVSTQKWRQDTLVIFIIKFSEDRGDLPVVAVVSKKVKNIINFEVVM